MNTPRFRVWHVPQVPMTAFMVEDLSYPQAARLCDILGNYDLFQLEHNVKPDFCNANGVQWNHPELTEGEWWDIEPDSIDDLIAEGADPVWFADGGHNG